MSAPRVVAVVAAHDEQERIARTVKAARAIPGVEEVLVVADGCRDRTTEEAVGAGARVLVAERRRGKGAAVDAALARIGSAGAVLLLDADVGDSAAEAGALLEPVVAGRLDLAVGRLPRQEGGGFGVVKRAAGLLIRALCGFRAAEPLSGQRAASRAAIEACRPLAGGFGMEVGMTIDAVRLGLRVGEVPIDMSHRPTGRSVAGFAHRARQGLDVLRAVAPRALRLR